MTRYEKLINGTKEELMNEFLLAMTWARNLPDYEWNLIVNGWPGLPGLVSEVFDQEVE